MKPAADALQQLLQSATAITDVESVALLEAGERVLAETLTAAIDVPPADNSAMDGYAFCSTDHPGGDGHWFDLSQRLPAGSVASPLTAGTAARIFTGAPIPAGADTVVMQEECKEKDGRVHIPAGVTAGNNVRPRGQDIASGATLATSGTRLTPQHLAVLAAAGIAEVKVYRPLTVAIFSTGDELAEPGTALQPGQIYNSNRYLLTGQLQRLGVRVLDLGRVADTAHATRDALQRAAAGADLILTTGGVSVGEEDHVKHAVQALGHIELWKLAIKPGKPLAFGRVGDTPFIGLPGNPLSSFVTFVFFARPYLQKLQGETPTPARGNLWPSTFARPARIRQEYLMVRLDQRGRLELYPNQSSGVMSSATWANAVAIVPANTEVVPGDPLEVVRFEQLF